MLLLSLREALATECGDGVALSGCETAALALLARGDRGNGAASRWQWGLLRYARNDKWETRNDIALSLRGPSYSAPE